MAAGQRPGFLNPQTRNANPCPFPDRSSVIEVGFASPGSEQSFPATASPPPKRRSNPAHTGGGDAPHEGRATRRPPRPPALPVPGAPRSGRRTRQGASRAATRSVGESSDREIHRRIAGVGPAAVYAPSGRAAGEGGEDLGAAGAAVGAERLSSGRRAERGNASASPGPSSSAPGVLRSTRPPASSTA